MVINQILRKILSVKSTLHKVLLSNLCARNPKYSLTRGVLNFIILLIEFLNISFIFHSASEINSKGFCAASSWLDNDNPECHSWCS